MVDRFLLLAAACLALCWEPAQSPRVRIYCGSTIYYDGYPSSPFYSCIASSNGPVLRGEYLTTSVCLYPPVLVTNSGLFW